jgi:hypothetical protein
MSLSRSPVGFAVYQHCRTSATGDRLVCSGEMRGLATEQRRRNQPLTVEGGRFPMMRRVRRARNRPTKFGRISVRAMLRGNNQGETR